ncbi:MAG: holo-ACP synthase [Elusimicrobiota bacterium]
MGVGMGLDVVEIERISSVATRNPRFLGRVFSAEELRYCRGKRNKWQHFAVRFAAKEAVWKAVGREGLRLRDISIRRSPLGRPSVLLEGRLAPDIQISLSHSARYAMAVALYLRRT